MSQHQQRIIWGAFLASLLLLLGAPCVSFAVQAQPESAPAAGAATPEGEASAPAEPTESLPILSILAALAVPVSLGLLHYRKWSRLDGKKLRWRRFEPIVGFMLLLFLFLAASLGATLALHLLFNVKGDLADLPDDIKLKASVIGNTGGYIGYAVVLFAARFVGRDRKKSSVPRLQRHTVSLPAAVLAGVGGLLLFWPLVMTAGLAASELQQWLWGIQSNRIAHETLVLLLHAEKDVWWTLTIALVLVAAPFFEETIYRGILQQTLRGVGLKPWHAIVVTSIIFALMHFNVAQPQAIVALFVFALGLGWIYERTGRLAAPIAMHMTFNLANLLLALWT